MKKLTLVCSPSLLEATKETILNIKKTAHNIFCEHFIVVPDRFSMQAENLVFEQLNVCSTMNVSVVGISRLATIILEEANMVSKTLSTNQSVLLVRKVVQENSKDFLFFNKSNISLGFCEELYATIQQLLASKATPETLIIQSVNKSFQNKMHDISLIMKAYQTELAGKFIDSNEKLELFEKVIPKSNMVKSSRFYFCQFDSFTEQGYAIFSSICEHALEVYIATPTANKQKNAYLYPTDLTDKISKLENMSNFIDVISAPITQNAIGLHVQTNLLVHNASAMDAPNFLTVRSAVSVEEEINFCLRNIKKLLLNKQMDVGDICVAVSQLDSKKQLIQKMFAQSGIPFFTDTTQTLLQTSLAQFVLELISVAMAPSQMQDVVSLFKHELFKMQDMEILENITRQFGIKKHQLLKPIKLQCDNAEYISFENCRLKIALYLSKLEKGIKQSKTVGEKIDFLQNFLIQLNAEQHLQQISQQQALEGNQTQSKIIEQTYKKFTELLDSVLLVYENAQLDWPEFAEILENGMQSMQISQVPISSKAVLIGDTQASFFPSCKAMFVLGASEGDFPAVQYDCGLISDREVEMLSNLNISPTIKMLNHRARFKVFQDLTLPSKHLFATFSATSDEKQVFPSSLILSLQKMFVGKQNIFSCNNDNEYAVLQLGEFAENKISASQLELPYLSFSKLQTEQLMLQYQHYDAAEYQLAFEELGAFLQFKHPKKQHQTTIDNAYKLFFANGYTSVSKMSSFLTCPRLFFLKQGLKTQERPDIKTEKKDIGSFLHKIAEIFVQTHATTLGTLQDTYIKNWVNSTLSQLFESKEFSAFASQDNAFINHVLKEESFALCVVLNSHQQSSLFKPTHFEKKFGKDKSFQTLSVHVPQGNVDIVGVIDRIDEYENMFRIIDYKTGSSKQSLTELFFGTNMQLMVYAFVARKALEKEFVGSFVFPISNSFRKKGDKNTNGMLVGFTPSDLDILQKMDKDIFSRSPDNKLIDVNFTSKQNLYKKDVIVSLQEMLLLSDYAFDVLSQAIFDLSEGEIAPSPIGTSSADLPCRYCFAKSVCPFNEKQDKFRKLLPVKIEDINSAITAKKGENNNA